MTEPRAPRMTIAAIVTAAGRGLRAGPGEPKQWRELAGRPVLWHAVEAMRPAGRVIVVLHPEDMARGLALFGGTVTLVAGAEDRAGSVRAALEALEGGEVTHVLIHDGARPLVRPRTVGAVIEALAGGAAGAAPGLAVTDALWQVEAGHIAGTAPRAGLARAQTPQGFALSAILAAHRAGPAGAPDDVTLALAAGLEVALVPGDEDNLKITWPGDLARAEAILARQGDGERMDMRIGNGFDVHAFGPGDHVMLCGVRIPHPQGLAGHSDADVGMHALTDAILGALAEGDIGRHFPPSDPQWKGADSAVFLAHAARIAAARGYALGNGDVTLICESPKVGPHAAAMQARLAEILGVEAGRISVKATTTERLGFAGRGEGIAAMATAAMIRTGG